MGKHEIEESPESIKGDISDIRIGKEPPKLKPKAVIIKSFKTVAIDKNGKPIGSKVVLVASHEDIGEIEISKVRFEKDGRLKESGLWVSLDNDEQINFHSAIAYLMRFMKAESLTELVGRKIETVIDDNGFLIFKAY